MADLVGRILGRYRVVSKLGRGGMAEVYKAYQPSLDRYVAIKVMLGHMVDDEDFVSRFEREALNTSKLTHSNIVRVIDFDHEYDKYFMVMEYIDGPTLKAEMRARQAANNPFNLKEIAQIFSSLCGAVEYAHRRKMIHRDIKPANVMINQEGRVVLTDFGIVRTMGGTQHTATGALTGTPAYMSPEQGRGERADERSDIYALGVMLYEMVTGRVPFDADTPFAVIMKHINEPLPLPSKVNPELPEAIERVVLKAMSKEPADRYQTAGEMARDLREAVGVGFGDLQKPLTSIAPKPKETDTDHPTGPITAEEKAATMAAFGGGGATVIPSADDRTMASTPPVAAPAQSGFPILPLAIGGGVILLLIIAGVFLISGITGVDTEATAVAIAAEASATIGAQATLTAQATEAEAEVDTPTPPPTNTPAPTDTPSPIPPGTPQAVANVRLEVWSGPGQEGYNLLGFLPSGAIAEIVSLDQTETWWKIKTELSPDGEGWIEVNDDNVAVSDTGSVPIALVPTFTPTPEPTLPPDTATPVPEDTETPTPAATATQAPTSAPLPTATDAPTATPAPPPVAGKLAFPVDNGAGAYDVFIYSLPYGDQLGKIQGARQPNFRGDGVKLLVNGQGGSFGEDVWEVGSNGSIDKPVSSSPSDEHPFYKPDGTTLTYGNPLLAQGSEGFQPYIFVQCSIKPPNQESGDCNDVAGFGVIVPAGQVGNVIGSNPVWTAGDLIAYKGCDTWAGGSGGSCGIYIVGSWATKRASNGENPHKLVDGGSTIPTDSKAGLVAFHSRESGDWEAYVVSEGGGSPINISNSPSSQDGLPTISPDGRQAIFASNRDGGWAFYVVSTSGGAATKLFDFPKANPWATGDRDWTTERISWGP